MRNRRSSVFKFALSGRVCPRTMVSFTVIWAALACALCAAISGYNVAVTAGALLYLKEDFGLTVFQEEIFVSALTYVSIIGVLSAGRLADLIGRQKSILIASLLFILGALLMGLAPQFTVLLAGRMVTGVGLGFAFHLGPVYLSEMAPAGSRGTLVTLTGLSFNLGVLGGFSSTFAVSGLPASVIRSKWRLILGLGGVPAVFLSLAALILSESPRWLALQGRLAEAKEVLCRTCDFPDHAAERLGEILDAAGMSTFAMSTNSAGLEAAEIKKANGASTPGKMSFGNGEGVWKELIWPSPSVRRMNRLNIGLSFFPHALGIDSIMFYGPLILLAAGFASPAAAQAAVVGVGAIKVVALLIATVLVDKVGRRPLMLCSTIGMTFAMATLAGAFLTIPTVGGFQPSPKNRYTSTHAPTVVMVAIYVFSAFFSVGFAPLCHLIQCEIYPVRLRAQALAGGGVINRAVAGTVSLTFLSLARLITPAGCFLVFTIMGVVCTLFLYTQVPETKGKSLEDIANMFQSNGSLGNQGGDYLYSKVDKKDDEVMKEGKDTL